MRLSLPLKNSFVRDESGSIAVFFGMSFMGLIMAISLAIDTSRVLGVASKVQIALDASALAAATYMSNTAVSDNEAKEFAKKAFDERVKSLNIGDITVKDFTLNSNSDTGYINVAAKIVAPSIIAQLAGDTETANLTPTATARNSDNRVELSMVLDVSGSMAGSRLQSLKDAAKIVVDLLYDNAPHENQTRIALAPYASSVNAGPYFANVTDEPSHYDTCVIERRGALVTTAEGPGGGAYLEVMEDPPLYAYGCPAAEVVPLSGKSQKEHLKSIIDSYQAGGATAGHIGTAWGWYMLSTGWGPAFPGHGYPAIPEDKKVSKHIIIMTDGVSNTAYTERDEVTPRPMGDVSYEMFGEICTNMKDTGITVWTIAFDLNDAAAQQHLSDCASSQDNVFTPDTNEELESAFMQVAQNLSRVYLSN